jgi:hypothetical protein
VGYENTVKQLKGTASLVAYRDVVIPKEVIREIEIYYLSSTAALLAQRK